MWDLEFKKKIKIKIKNKESIIPLYTATNLDALH